MAFNVAPLDRVREWILGVRVTQQFGPSDLQGEPTYDGYDNFHKGVDFVVPGGRGANIYAPASGRVLYAGDNGNGFGNHVIIEAPSGFTYLLGHLNDFDSLLYGSGQQPGPLRAGTLVHVGDQIGHQGGVPNTQGAGYSTGAHVHLEITAPNGRPVDPGRNGINIFYTLYHDLGFGAGYVPGQNNSIPDPVSGGTWALPVPSILPTNPGNADTRYYVGLGERIGEVFAGNYDDGTYTGPASGPGGYNGTGYYNPGAGAAGQATTGFLASLSKPGGLLANTSSDNGQSSDDPIGTIVLVGVTVLLGTVFIIVGLVKLGKEGPVASVVQPVAGVAKGTLKTGAKVAALAA